MDKLSVFKSIRFVSVVLLIVLLTCNFSYSQEQYSVFGKVKIENGTNENTYITILKNAEKMETKILDNSGKFEYKLDFGHEYILEFSQEGFVKKKVSISTFVPDDVLDRDNKFPPFKFMVSLFPAYKGLDLSIFDQPMGMIMYDKELDDFDYDRDYDSQIRDAIKRAEEEARARAAELEAQRLAQEKAYLAAIKQGDLNFKLSKYDLSKVAYTEALAIKEEEAYPKSQIAKIDELLAQQLAEADEAARLAAEKKALDEKYAAIVALADSQFSSGDYPSSKISYGDALVLKSAEAYPKSQIAKIDELLAKQLAEADEAARLAAEKKALEEKYAAIVALADSQFSSGDYPSSKTSYGDALVLKSAEAYPKSQIAKIDELLAKQLAEADEAARLAAEKKALEEKYAAIVALADSQFAAGNYSSSKTSYGDALVLKSAEAYPKSQIAKIDELLAKQEAAKAASLAAQQKALDKKYTSIITLADSQFTAGNYSRSKISYREALALKSMEAYPKSQIEMIESLLTRQQAEIALSKKLSAQQKALDEDYAGFIALADSQFAAGNYVSAKTSYGDALDLKLTEAYPKSQIEKIDKLLAKQLIDADKAERLAAEKKVLDEKYAEIISLADSQFSAGKYLSSKTSYADALALKSAEAYPKSQIAKIDKFLAKQLAEANEVARLAAEKKALDEKYAEIISLADSQFSSGDYPNSKTSYGNALVLKSAEAYPKSQIEKIDILLAKQLADADAAARLAAEKKALDEKFNSFIRLADSQFASESYELAKKNYNFALQVKHDEDYPKNQIEKIDQILNDLRNKEADKLRLAAELKEYNSLIGLADKYYDEKRWQSAIDEYEKAKNMKPEDAYPQNRIDEIKLILIDIAKLEEEKMAAQNQYKALIAAADKNLNEEDYSLALNKYREALTIKPKDAYPKNQITRIEVLLDKKRIADRKLKELNEKYAFELEKADEAFKKEQFSVARHHYKGAVAIKPDAEYPLGRLAEIEKLIEALKLADAESLAKNAANFESKLSIAREREYASLILEGDEAFKLFHFSVAKVMYDRSIELFDREYPKKKLKEIDKLIREGKDAVLTEEYHKLIARGDKELTNHNYSVSKFYYQKAIELNAYENYPKNQIKKIDELILSKLNAKSDIKYKELLKKADEAFEKKSWTVARFYYQKAKIMRPNEEYPKEKLILIKSNQTKK